jgi:hypothetical protein
MQQLTGHGEKSKSLMPIWPRTSGFSASSRTSGFWKRVRSSGHFWPILLILASVLAGNSLYILHFLDPNPINYLSGIGSISTGGVIAGSTAADPNNGFTAQAFGHLVAVDWIHGHIPWWNPFEGLGSPLAGEMQAGAFFPTTMLLLLSNGQVYAHAIVEAIAGISTYLLLAKVGVGRLASLGGGIAFTLNGTYSWFSHAPTAPVAFLPLLLLGVEYGTSTSSLEARKGWRIIALALALSIYAGFPETAYIDGILAGIWCLVRALQSPGSRWRFIFTIGKGVSVGLLLAAPVIVAFADYLPQAFVGAHNGTFASSSLPHVAAAQNVAPYLFGSINMFSSADHSGTLTLIWGNVGGYLTASICVLALIGLYDKRFRLLKAALLIWIVFALGRTYGITPFTHIINALPGMGDVAFYRYSDPSWEFAAVILGAFGIDDLMKGRVRQWWLVLCLATGLGGVGVAFLGTRSLLRALDGVSHDDVWAHGSLVWAIATIALIGFVAFSLSGRLRGVLLVSIVSLDALAMFIIPQLSAPRSAAVDTAPVSFLQHHLGQYRFYTLGPIAPNYGSYFGLSSLSTNDLPVPKLWAHYMTNDLDTNANPIVFNGVERNNPSGPSAIQEFEAHLGAFENSGVKYLLIASGATVPTLARGQQLRLVFSDTTTQIYQLPAPRPIFTTTSNDCVVTYLNVNAVHVDCPTTQVLVRRELYMKGWTASVNGAATSVSQSAAVFQKLAIPSGRSTIVFNFTPPHTDLAWYGCLVSVGCLVIPSIRRRRSRSRRPTHAAPRTDLSLRSVHGT